MTTNIQVVVRCRGRNSREIAAKSPVSVNLPSDTCCISNPTISIQQGQQIPNLLNAKIYSVDQVYGPHADQEMLFDKVARPLFLDFFGGLNVTVLAYGQTGTGKTHTMCGNCQIDSSKSDSRSLSVLDDSAGIIPRVLAELFKSLSANDEDDYVIKCSFVELYNESLKDLLSEESDKEKGSLRIFEQKKSTGSSVLIQNLSEVYITTINQGLDILQKGINKRKTASTKLNNFSSRSHTIFTISLFRKQSDNSFVVSKINLVDLAGSENINRSGAINQRAKEAGSINQSLLTLGRVINTLSDKSDNLSNSHIPYRESKLTRLLQDSIGGKTKTALIATISPAKINLDETISTLEYASRAKNILNKPQVGEDSEMVLKKVLFKDMAKEISKLTSDLIATRSKHGIYLDEKNYNQLIEDHELVKVENKELISLNSANSVKISNLSKLNKEQEQENADIKLINKELQLEIEDLMKKQVDYERKIQMEKEEMDKLRFQFKSLMNLSKEYQDSKDNFERVMNETINFSVVRIDETVNRIKEEEASGIKDIETMRMDIKENLHKAKADLESTISEIQTQVQGVSSKVPLILTEMRDSIIKLTENHQNLSSELDGQLSNFTESSRKFDQHITNTHLSRNIFEQHINHINKDTEEKMRSLNENLLKSFSKLFDEAKQDQQSILKSALKGLYHDYVEVEKGSLLSQYIELQQSKKLFEEKAKASISSSNEKLVEFSEDIEKSVEHGIGDISSSLAADIKSSLNKASSLLENQAILQLPDSLVALGKSIKSGDAEVISNLSSMKSHLDSVMYEVFKREESAKGQAKVSPIKEEKNQYISTSPSHYSKKIESSPTMNAREKKSPAKQHHFSSSYGQISNSRIPQLARSYSDKENFQFNSKKRRILSDIDSN